MCKKPTRHKLFQSSAVERSSWGAGERRRKEQKDNRGNRGGRLPPLPSFFLSSCRSSCPPVLCASAWEWWRLVGSSWACGLFMGGNRRGVAGGWVGSGVEGGGWQGGSVFCIQDGVGTSGKDCKPGASTADGTHCSVEHWAALGGRMEPVLWSLHTVKNILAIWIYILYALLLCSLCVQRYNN